MRVNRQILTIQLADKIAPPPSINNSPRMMLSSARSSYLLLALY
ncbi:hypothetical protein LCGC14_2898040, partial [marine sediment metagenome]